MAVLVRTLADQDLEVKDRRDYHRAYYAANRQRVRRLQKVYYEKHAEKIKAKARLRYKSRSQEAIEKRRARDMIWRANNRERIALKHRLRSRPLVLALLIPAKHGWLSWDA